MKISLILDQIDLGNYALPEFQRGYVWNRDQVRKLMSSLYKGYPIGSLLTWLTHTSPEIIRSEDTKEYGTVHLILDGQQRVTTLYGLIRGKEPPFFQGDKKAFTELFFNVETEVFEFYMPIKMQNDPNWISVTELMQTGVGNMIQKNNNLMNHIDKLNNIGNIKEVDLPIQEVSGEDKTVDVVVEIFNHVNSGGTKLSKGDLALAKICAQWPNARDELRAVLKRFKEEGFQFSMDWLLRCITVHITGQPYFSVLSRVDTQRFKTALKEVEILIGTILDQIGSRLGLDHDRVLQGRYAIPVIIAIINQKGTRNIKNKEWNKILYWYIHSFLWGRYSGSTESTLAKDLNSLNDGGGIEGLIALLRTMRGDLIIKPEDFVTWSTGSRFYPLLFLMTRVYGSVDWYSGIELKKALLGRNSSLEIHHIFPKVRLYKAGYKRQEVNTLANFTFLTKDTNIQISNRLPSEYLPQIVSNIDGALESHWMPMEPRLWEIENYMEFVQQRRVLLADAANRFLNSLYNSDKEGQLVRFSSNQNQEILDDEDETILQVSKWMEERGLNKGEIHHEVIDENGKLVATLNIAWPEGVQQGLSEPVAILIDESEAVYNNTRKLGFKYFDDIQEFKNYVTENYLL